MSQITNNFSRLKKSGQLRRRRLYPRWVYGVALALCCLGQDARADERYDLVFSTYLGGGDDWDQARDVCADGQGNVYVTGGATSSDFPVTAGAFDTTYNTGGSETGSGGDCDVFVSKFDANGALVWSTYIGSPNYDRGYAIEVDDAGYVYVAGRAGPGFPVTVGAVQTEFKGLSAGIYGMQNGFVAKLEPDGSDLVWATYIGLGSLVRDFDIDDSGAVYTSLPYEGSSSFSLPASWFSGALQPNRNGGAESGLVKIAPDGASVVWATWLGGSDDEQKEANVRVDAAGNVYIGVGTRSADIPTTPGAHDNTHNGDWDAYFAKLSPGGDQLLFATFFGGTGDQFGCSTHNLAVDAAGNLYHSIGGQDGDYPITSGTYQTVHGGGSGDMVVAKFSSTGTLLASTYLGGSGAEDPDGIYVDAAGAVYLSGATSSSDFPLSSYAHQPLKGASADVFFVKLSSDLNQLLYATYLGGDAYDYGRSSFLDEQGNWWVTGSSDGAGWPTLNAFQERYAGGVGSCTEGGCYAGDAILARFSPASTPSSDAGVDADTPDSSTGNEDADVDADTRDSSPGLEDAVVDADMPDRSPGNEDAGVDADTPDSSPGNEDAGVITHVPDSSTGIQDTGGDTNTVDSSPGIQDARVSDVMVAGQDASKLSSVSNGCGCRIVHRTDGSKTVPLALLIVLLLIRRSAQIEKQNP